MKLLNVGVFVVLVIKLLLAYNVVLKLQMTENEFNNLYDKYLDKDRSENMRNKFIPTIFLSLSIFPFITTIMTMYISRQTFIC